MGGHVVAIFISILVARLVVSIVIIIIVITVIVIIIVIVSFSALAPLLVVILVPLVLVVVFVVIIPSPGIFAPRPRIMACKYVLLWDWCGGSLNQLYHFNCVCVVFGVVEDRTPHSSQCFSNETLVAIVRLRFFF